MFICYDVFMSKSADSIFEELDFSPIENLIFVANGDVVNLGLMTQKELDDPGKFDTKKKVWTRKPGKEIAKMLIPMKLRFDAMRELAPYGNSKKAPIATQITQSGEEEEIIRMYLPTNGREANLDAED